MITLQTLSLCYILVFSLNHSLSVWYMWIGGSTNLHDLYSWETRNLTSKINLLSMLRLQTSLHNKHIIQPTLLRFT